MTTVTVIETGEVPAGLRDTHGTYPDMFARALGGGSAPLAFRIVRAATDTLPRIAEVEAVLITGSSAGVTDDLPWIAPLEAFVRRVHAAAIPMVGVCFGHQLIAQALGGVVRKAPGGWGLGRHVYAVTPGSGVLAGAEVAVACSHQDQVIVPPEGATTFMASRFTPHAGLRYANGTTLSVQPHPEFTPAYAAALCHLRAAQLPAAEIAEAVESLALPLDSAALSQTIARFLAAPPGRQA